MNEYKKERENSITKCRFAVGFTQLISKPWYILIFFIELIIFLLIWYNRKVLFIPTVILSQDTQKIVGNIVSVLLVILLIVSALATVRGIGNLASSKIERNLSKAFTQEQLRYGTPILSHITHKGTLLIYEFFSEIPLFVWEKQRESIAYQLQIDFTNEGIRYSDRKTTGKYICIYARLKHAPKQRRELYDPEW